MASAQGASQAESYAAHRSNCYAAVEAFEGERSRQYEIKVGMADVRMAEHRKAFRAAHVELDTFAKCLARNTRLEAALVAAHHDTRALLLESNVLGFSITHGRAARQNLGPLGELLLATHQLDWRLGERALAYSELMARLGRLVDEFTADFVSATEKVLSAAEAARVELRKRADAVGRFVKAHAAGKPHSGSSKRGGDLWLLENELRVACRLSAQAQARFHGLVADADAELPSLVAWKDAGLDHFAGQFARANQTFRDDLCRVGSRLLRCGRAPEFCRFDDGDLESHVADRVVRAHSALPNANEALDEFELRQDSLDSTATTRGALVFPTFERITHSNVEKSAAAPTHAAAPDVPDMPRTRLVAKKGALELGGASFGWAGVFCVLSYDGFLHAFPGRTEGSAEHEAAVCRVDLAKASVSQEEEGPVITISTPRSTALALLGDRQIRLRCKNAADKFAWFAALADPLALFRPSDADGAADAAGRTDADGETAPAAAENAAGPGAHAAAHGETAHPAAENDAPTAAGAGLAAAPPAPAPTAPTAPPGQTSVV